MHSGAGSPPQQLGCSTGTFLTISTLLKISQLFCAVVATACAGTCLSCNQVIMGNITTTTTLSSTVSGTATTTIFTSTVSLATSSLTTAKQSTVASSAPLATTSLLTTNSAPTTTATQISTAASSDLPTTASVTASVVTTEPPTITSSAPATTTVDSTTGLSTTESATTKTTTTVIEPTSPVTTLPTTFSPTGSRGCWSYTKVKAYGQGFVMFVGSVCIIITFVLCFAECFNIRNVYMTSMWRQLEFFYLIAAMALFLMAFSVEAYYASNWFYDLQQFKNCYWSTWRASAAFAFFCLLLYIGDFVRLIRTPADH